MTTKTGSSTRPVCAVCCFPSCCVSPCRLPSCLRILPPAPLPCCAILSCALRPATSVRHHAIISQSLTQSTYNLSINLQSRFNLASTFAQVPELQLPLQFTTDVGGELADGAPGVGRVLSVSFNRCMAPDTPEQVRAAFVGCDCSSLFFVCVPLFWFGSRGSGGAVDQEQVGRLLLGVSLLWPVCVGFIQGCAGSLLQGYVPECVFTAGGLQGSGSRWLGGGGLAFP